MENSNIAWTHNTQNFWLGCDKIAPECAHCYIGRTLRQQGREPWGQLYRTKTWNNPAKWQKQAEARGICYRVFTNSLSDFFHAKADAWREEAWNIIRETPNLIWLILTKRPELVASRLPKDWSDGYPNVWLGTSVGCNQTLNKMDTLRRIPIHPQAVRFVSCEPLLEDIADEINLDGFRWLIVGGESGGGQEYLWDKTKDWRQEFDISGRRTMKIEWAWRLLEKSHAVGLSFFFKQVTSFRSGVGEDALGQIYHEFPPAPQGTWADKMPIEAHVLINISAAQSDELENNSSKTQQNSCEFGSNEPSKPAVPTAAELLAAFQLLHEAAYAKADELADDFQTLMRRFDEELLPLVDRAQAYLSERGSMYVPGIGLPPWGEWRDAFLKRLKHKMSLSTLKRRLNDFRNLDVGDPTEQSNDDDAFDEELIDESEDSPTFTMYESPKDSLRKRLKEIHTVLSRGVAPVDANPAREDARRIDFALQLLEETLLAIDEGLFDKLPEDCGGCQHLHRGIVTLAKTNPDWTDERLADETKTSLITIRQARTRYATWGNDEHE